MRYFFDTEFIDQRFALRLLSIGVVAEDGREFYAVVNFDDWELAGDAGAWLRENVIARLQPVRSPIVRRQPLDEIRADLLAFLGDDAAPEFWAYYGAHDWVALCGLMGGLLALPAGWPWLVRDLRVELDREGFANVKDDGRADEHNALADARWVRDAHKRHIVENHGVPRLEPR